MWTGINVFQVCFEMCSLPSLYVCFHFCVCVCLCLLFCRDGVCVQYVQYACLYTVNSVVIWSEPVCLCVLCNVCVWTFFFFFFCRRLLERITSFKEYEIQHLLKSDTLWHCFEAMKVRLERHGSSFSPQSRGFMSLGWGQLSFHWSVMPQRERQSCHLKRFTCIFFRTLKGQFNDLHTLMSSNLV